MTAAADDKEVTTPEKTSTDSGRPPASITGNSSGAPQRSGGYNTGDRGASSSGGYADRGYSDRGQQQGDRQRTGPMEVIVEHNIEKAMRILKRKLIKEGLFKELKARRYYEKPSERKKRKDKESKKKTRKDEARARKNPMLLA